MPNDSPTASNVVQLNIRDFSDMTQSEQLLVYRAVDANLLIVDYHNQQLSTPPIPIVPDTTTTANPSILGFVDREEDEEDEYCDDECFGIIHDYSYKPYPIFHPSDKDGELFLGVELETDKYSKSKQHAAEKIAGISSSESLFYLKEDASLYDGFEIVTHPATLSFHRKGMPWESMLQTIVQSGGNSNNTTTCGLHVHMSKLFFGQSEDEQDTHLLKMLHLLEKFWQQLFVFSRRESQSGFAQRYNKPFYFDELDEVKKLKQRDGHFQALNISPYNTIELRIFRGTLELPTLMATIELCDYFARFSKKYSTVLMHKLNWAGFANRIPPTRYPNLATYMKEYNLCAL